MDSMKLVKMNAAELEKEISSRQKKIKTLKSEIALLEKLRIAENKISEPAEDDDVEGQQVWHGTR